MFNYNHTYIANELYWISFYSGRYHVMTPDNDDNECIYSGTYSDCLNYFNQLRIECEDYELNL